jgi:hypothetical protein
LHRLTGVRISTIVPITPPSWAKHFVETNLG